MGDVVLFTPYWDGQGVPNRGVPRLLPGRLCEGLQPGGWEGLLHGLVCDELVEHDNPFQMIGLWNDWVVQLESGVLKVRQQQKY